MIRTKTAPPATASEAEWRKQLIQDRLVHSVRRIQTHCGHTEHVVMSDGQMSSDLLSSVEALFLHGLLQANTRRKIFNRNADSRLQDTHFWMPALVFSNSCLIQQIEQLRRIHSDVGRCRVWIRLALNDGTLSCFLDAMVAEEATLKRHYHTLALLRDARRMRVISQCVAQLHTCHFNLALNSMLLNQWQNSSLILAGLVPGLLDSPSPASDAPVDDPKADREGTVADALLASTPESHHFIDQGFVDEDDALRTILSAHKKQPQPPQPPPPLPPTAIPDPDSHSPDQAADVSIYCLDDTSICQITESRSSSANASMESTSNTSPDERRPAEQSQARPLDAWTVQMWTGDDADPDAAAYRDADDDAHPVLRLFSQWPELISPLSRLVPNLGLDGQNYQCYGCSKQMGLKLRLCHFSQKYFCVQCHRGDRALIPMHIINKWDFRPKQVSRRAKIFLDRIRIVPVLEFDGGQDGQVGLRDVVPELYYFMSLRRRLVSLNWAVQQCSRPPSKLLRTDLIGVMWPRSYLLTSVKQYSVSDLELIRAGQLTRKAERAVHLGLEHVSQCQECHTLAQPATDTSP